MVSTLFAKYGTSTIGEPLVSVHGPLVCVNLHGGVVDHTLLEYTEAKERSVFSSHLRHSSM